MLTLAPIGLRTSGAVWLAWLGVLVLPLLHPPRVAMNLGALCATLVFAALSALAVREPGAVPIEAIVVHPVLLALTTGLVAWLGQGWTDAVRESARMRVELAGAADLSSQESQAKSAFLAAMSHELRTPLNAVIGYAELAQDQARTEGTVDPEDMVRIERAGQHLLDLVNQVLDLSRVEAGSLALAVRETDLGGVVHEVVDTLAGPVARNGNALQVEIDDVPPLLLDPLRIRQILTNLVGNAAKFTENGTIRVVLARRHGEIALSVHDTGIGIPLAQQGRIFEPFVQAGTQERYGGTGLGLAISRRLAEEMGGTLTVDSEVGIGSCFTLHFPAAPPPEVPAYAPEACTSPLRAPNREDATGDSDTRTASERKAKPIANRS
jgi:signal transduction histidine kinase